MNSYRVFLPLMLLLASVPAVAGSTYMGKVVRILDGDTLEVVRAQGAERTIQRIRLASIDAPESTQDFGEVSRQALAGLCFGKMAQIDPQKQDRYGRTLANVTCDGAADTAAMMVASGMAWVYTRYSSDSALRSLEQRARHDRLGLWSRPNPVPPWEYRHARP